MNRIIYLTIALAGASVLGGCVSSIETVSYSVVKSDGPFEIRQYQTYLVAETVVDSSLEDAGNRAFRKLFKYISGNNKSRQDIAMTSPVTQEKSSEKIAMTAPVEQRPSDTGWTVSFVMPSTYTLPTLPVPNDPDITLREVPARRMASIRYSGGWSEGRYRKHLEKLEGWIAGNSLTSTGSPIWARYNSPFALWFLRRNEVLIPLAGN